MITREHMEKFSKDEGIVSLHAKLLRDVMEWQQQKIIEGTAFSDKETEMRLTALMLCDAITRIVKAS